MMRSISFFLILLCSVALNAALSDRDIDKLIDKSKFSLTATIGFEMASSTMFVMQEETDREIKSVKQIQALLRKVERQPENYRAFIEIADYYYDTGKNDEASMYYSKALSVLSGRLRKIKSRENLYYATKVYSSLSGLVYEDESKREFIKKGLEYSRELLRMEIPERERQELLNFSVLFYQSYISIGEGGQLKDYLECSEELFSLDDSVANFVNLFGAQYYFLVSLFINDRKSFQDEYEKVTGRTDKLLQLVLKKHSSDKRYLAISRLFETGRYFFQLIASGSGGIITAGNYPFSPEQKKHLLQIQRDFEEIAGEKIIKNMYIYSWLGLVHYLQLDYRDAVTSCMKSMESEYSHNSFTTIMTILLFCENNLDEALKVIRDCEKRFSETEIQFYKIRLLLAKGDLAGADKEAENLYLRFPGDNDVRLCRAIVKLKKKDFKTCSLMLDLIKAGRSYQRYDDYQIARSILMIINGRTDEAKKTLHQLLEHDPGNMVAKGIIENYIR